MVVLNFEFELKTLSGGSIGKENKKPVMIGKVLAGELIGKTPGIEPLKAYHWALKLWNGEKLEIDEADYDKLYKFISENNNMTNLFVAQALTIMKEQKDKE